MALITLLIKLFSKITWRKLTINNSAISYPITIKISYHITIKIYYLYIWKIFSKFKSIDKTFNDIFIEARIPFQCHVTSMIDQNVKGYSEKFQRVLHAIGKYKKNPPKGRAGGVMP